MKKYAVIVLLSCLWPLIALSAQDQAVDQSLATQQKEALSPLIAPGATTIDTDTAWKMHRQKVVFIDVRGDGYWHKGHIPGAIHLEIPTQLTPERLEQYVKPDQPVVFYCQGVRCWRSYDAIARAVAWGFKKIYYYREGFPAWQAAGYPVLVSTAPPSP